MYLSVVKTSRSQARPRAGLRGVGPDLTYYSGSTNGWPDWILSPFCGDFQASFAADNMTPVCRAFHAKNSAELRALPLPLPPVTGAKIPVPVLNADGTAANPGTAVDDLIRANKARQDLLNQQFFDGLPVDPATPPGGDDEDAPKTSWSAVAWAVGLTLAGVVVLSVVTRR